MLLVEPLDICGRPVDDLLNSPKLQRNLAIKMSHGFAVSVANRAYCHNHTVCTAAILGINSLELKELLRFKQLGELLKLEAR